MKFNKHIEEMEQAVLDCLSPLENGYGMRKWAISEETGIPEDVLKVILKRLKDSDKIELIMIFSESTGMADGSGYCLKGKMFY